MVPARQKIFTLVTCFLGDEELLFYENIALRAHTSNVWTPAI